MANAATQKVKVTRPFMLNGKPTKVGSVVEVSATTAAELVAMNKAVRETETVKDDAKDGNDPKSKSESKKESK